MKNKKDTLNRRSFIKASGIALTATLTSPLMSTAAGFKNELLQAWSCGGLAEAFIPASREYELTTGCTIAYTGAFAGALGKSLLGSATTEVFAPRVLELAQTLKQAGKMLSFQPLCFTKYVLVVPKGNPAGIESIEDMAKTGVRVILTPNASPPGGKASMIILQKAGILKQAQKNAVMLGDCVQTAMGDLIKGKGDVAVMEQRLTRIPSFQNKTESIDIPEKFIPAKPVPFTIGMMKWAKNKELAEDFIKFIVSEKGQSYFEQAGFIPARSQEGERLTQKYGVIDA